MKSLPFLFLFFAILSPMKAFSQDYEADELAPADEESVVAEEIAAVSDNSDTGEIERQEDVIPAEEFE